MGRCEEGFARENGVEVGFVLPDVDCEGDFGAAGGVDGVALDEDAAAGVVDEEGAGFEA